MSCLDVMYQSGLSSCFSSFTPTNYAAPYQQQPSAIPSSAAAPISSNESFKKLGPSRMYTDRYHGPLATGSRGVDHSSSHLSGHDCLPASAYQRSNLSGSSVGSSSTSGAAKDSAYDTGEKVQSCIYVSPTSQIFTFYSEDTAVAVEDHFNKSLNPSNNYGKGSIPMISRNLPPSFWNCNTVQPSLQPHSAGTYNLPYHGYPGATSNDYGYGDSYYAPSFHPSTFQHSQPDPWQYAYNSAAAAAQTLSAVSAQRAAAMADFTANRFSSSYNQLLFPPSSAMRTSRLDASAPCKSVSSWATHPVFGSDIPHYGTMPTDYDTTFSGKGHQTKELYWH